MTGYEQVPDGGVVSTPTQGWLRTMMVGKVHRAIVTAAELDYVGSITLDADLLAASGILPGQQVDVVDVTNGARLTTYAIAGDPGSGVVCVNGAAAHLVHPGDMVIVIAYAMLPDHEARTYNPNVVHVDAANRIVSIDGDPGAAPEGMHTAAIAWAPGPR